MLVVPIVHMNGTSKKELLQLRQDAYLAICQAEKALQQMSPNGRDYYPEPGRLEKAQAQQIRRMEILSSIKTELIAEVDAIE